MEQSFKGADNKHYNLSPLTLGDLRKFVSFVQYKPWQDFQDLKERLEPDDFKQESQKLLHECAQKRLSESSPEVQDAMGTVDGASQLLFYSLKRNHPTLTAEDVGEIITLQNLDEVSDKISVISGLAPSAKKKSTRKKTS